MVRDDRVERSGSRKGASRASLVFAFAAGAAAATVFLEVYGVAKLSAGPAPAPAAHDAQSAESAGGPGALVDGVRGAAEKFAVYARSFASEAKNEAESSEADPTYRSVLTDRHDGDGAMFVPDPAASPVLAKAALIEKLPAISGVPAAEVLEACAKNVDRALAARLVWGLSRGEAWSVGEVGGDVVAASTKSGAIRLIGRYREAGRNFNVGVLQLNAGTLARYGVSPEEALEPCLNLQIGADRLGTLYEAALRRIPAGGALAAQEAVTRFLVENFRSGSFAADPAQQHADGMPIDFGGNASGASVGLAAGAQPKVSGGDPLRPSSSPADGLSGREAGSGPSGLIF